MGKNKMKTQKTTTTDENGELLEVSEIKLFSFSELSDEAKEKAIEHWRDIERDFAWAGEWQDSLDEFCKVFPIEWAEWDIYHGISYKMICDDEISELSDVRLSIYLQNYDIGDDCPFTGFCGDEDILEPMRDFLKKPDDRDFESLLYECLQSWLSGMRKDYEYQLSDEYISETLEINEYDFNENGEMI
jgi:hypothetical protein